MSDNNFDNIPEPTNDNNNNQNNNKHLNLKIFIIIPIIAIILRIVLAIVGGVTGMKIGGWLTPIVIIICVVCVIIFFRKTAMSTKATANNKNINQLQTEPDTFEQRQNGVKYMEENCEQVDAIVKKYSQAIYNYVDTIQEISEKYNATNPFLIPLESAVLPNASTLTIPFSASINLQLKDLLTADSMLWGRTNSEFKSKKYYDEMVDLTRYVVNGLKERILQGNEWVDQYTMPTLIYMVIRNNVIKYYHDKFEEEYKNIVSIHDFCNKFSEDEQEHNLMKFVCFHIYKTDITLSIKKAYKKICVETNFKKQTNKSKSKKGDNGELPH